MRCWYAVVASLGLLVGCSAETQGETPVAAETTERAPSEASDPSTESDSSEESDPVAVTAVELPLLVDADEYAAHGSPLFVPELVGLDEETAWEWAEQSGFIPIDADESTELVFNGYRLRIITNDDGIVIRARTG